ncbi:hypothetical protein GCM10009060_12990 [Halorubrum trapanicum]
MSVPDPIDVPDRVVEAGGQELSITSIARVEPGEGIEASTTAPENENYLLLHYNSSGSMVDFAPMVGNGSTTFSTDEIDAGTYLLVLDGDGGRATQPVVVAGYDAELTVPDEAKPGETVNATVELDSITDDEPAIDSVELVVMDGSEPEQIEADATDTSGDTFVYETGLTVPDEEGEYEVFSSVFGEGSIADTTEQEVLEITETSIEVSEATTDGGSDRGSADGGDGDGDSDSDTENTSDSSDNGASTGGSGDNTSDGSDNGEGSTGANETESNENGTDTLDGNETDENSTDSIGGNETDGNDTDTDGSSNSGSSNDGTDDESSDSSESTSDGNGSIEPNDTDDVVSEEQAPLTGVPQFLAALLAIGLLSRTRSRD